MLKITTLFILFLLFINANEITYERGWQLRGTDSNFSTIKILQNTNIESIWGYKNGKWYADFQNKKNNFKIERLKEIKNNEGFWIKAKNRGSFGYTPSYHDILNVKKGWNIYGVSKELNPSTFNNQNIKIIWTFNNKLNSWRGYSSHTDIQNLIHDMGLEKITKILPNEGFWLQSMSDINLTLKQSQEEKVNNAKVYGINIYARQLRFDEYQLPPLSDNEFNSLSENNKYLVANKLLGSLFYGFDYVRLKKLIESGKFISTIQELFTKDVDEQEIIDVDKKMDYYIHNRNYSEKRVAPIMARLYELKPSKYFIDNWVAYVLTQTILFSPAYELDSVNYADIMNVYRRLVDSFEQGYSLQWTTFLHTISDDNWRRFRSPEDNGREMLEIYLMDFNDSHVPLVAKALKNWKLDRRSESLEIGFDKNREPISNLFKNTTITDGFDFYSKLVLQPTFLKTVITRLVQIYFPNFTISKQEEVIDKIIKSNPKTWQDILKEIVFSKEYLLYSQKIKSLEEVFYQTSKALHWKAKYNTFSNLNYYLSKMHQSTMKYKLGRKVTVPIDTQSFAWFQRTVSGYILTNYENNTSLESSDDGWNKYELFKTLPPELFGNNEVRDDGKHLYQWYPYERKRANYIINYLFYSIASRKPTDEEMKFLTDLIDEEKRYSDTFDNPYWIDLYGHKKAKDDWSDRGYFAALVLDYISRLDTIYIFKAIKDK